MLKIVFSPFLLLSALFITSRASAQAPPPILDVTTASICEFDLSPDGMRLAWLAERDGERRLYIRELYDGHSVMLARAPGLSKPHWSRDNRHIYVMSDPTGGEQEHLFSFDTASPTESPRDLTPYPGRRAELIDVNDPDGSALVGINLASLADFGVYKVSPTGGAPVLVDPAQPGRYGWLVTLKGEIFGHVQVEEERRLRLDIKLPNQDSWHKLPFSGDFLVPGDNVAAAGSPQSDGSVWFLTRGSQDKATPQRVNLRNGQSLEQLPADDVDVDSLTLDGNSVPLLVQSMPGFPSLRILDPILRKLLESVPLPIHSSLRTVSSDFAVARFVMRFEADTGEENLVYVDRTRGISGTLFHQASPFLLGQLPRTIPIAFAARDQLPLHGYLTVPANLPPRNLPLILVVHGGPWVRDQWGFDINVISLALQGYAVLRVNYRGSSGYGRQFEEAGKGEWGGKMQDDLTDAVCWAVNQGVADPARMAVMGGSYGGYAALMALERTPKLFVAGIDQDGPVDLPRWLDEMAPYAKPYQPIIQAFVGSDRGTQWERSPLAHIDRIERPVLAFQGVNDPRVRVSQLEELEKAMKEAGKMIATSYLPDEGHGIAHEHNFTPYMAKVLEFLKKNFDNSNVSDATSSYCK